MPCRIFRPRAADHDQAASPLSEAGAASAVASRSATGPGKTSTREEDADAGPVKWSQERRLQFIDFRLQWGGRIKRRDVTDFFKISVPQASTDIARDAELAPGNLEYDTSFRTYVATPAFTPVFESSGARQYLSQLLASARKILAADQALMAFRPP